MPRCGLEKRSGAGRRRVRSVPAGNGLRSLAPRRCPPCAGRGRGAVRPVSRTGAAATSSAGPIPVPEAAAAFAPGPPGVPARDSGGSPCAARRAAGSGSGPPGSQRSAAPLGAGQDVSAGRSGSSRAAGLVGELRAAASWQEGRPEPRFGQKPNAGRNHHEIPADQTPRPRCSASGLLLPLGASRSPARPAGVSQCPAARGVGRTLQGNGCWDSASDCMSVRTDCAALLSHSQQTL